MDSPLAGHVLDFVVLQQPPDPAGELVDDLALPRHQTRQVELHALDRDAHGRRLADALQERAGGDHGLRGDAADVEARAAEEILVDDGHLLAELGEADGADVAGGTGAEDDDVTGCGHGVMWWTRAGHPFTAERRRRLSAPRRAARRRARTR